MSYGFVFPPTTATGSTATEFIGDLIVPVANKWVGLALGGQMANNLLLVAWPNSNTIMISPRYTTYEMCRLLMVLVGLLICFPADMCSLLRTQVRRSQFFRAA